MTINEPIPSPFQEGKFDKDNGHIGLITDLGRVYREASTHAFHDYKGKKYPIPKVALVVSLERIISRAKSGYYDNKNIV